MSDQHGNKMLAAVVALISKPETDRLDIELGALIPWLCKRSQIFRYLKKDVLMTLLRSCDYENVHRDHVIIRQGDTGHCFYIMLTGRSSLYIDPSKIDCVHSTNAEETEPAAAADEWVEEWDGRGGKKFRLNRSKFGNFIKNFEAGTSFGELALLRKNAIRNASIIADEDTDLLVISKDLFDITLKDNQEEEFRKRKDFINETPLFDSWAPKMKRLLEMSLRKEIFPFDSPIVKQGQPVIGLHFIIKGQAKITVESSMHQQQYPKVMDQRAKLLAEISKNFEKKEQSVKESRPTQNEHIRIRRQEGYAAAERHLAKKSVTLCVVDHSEIIGATEQLLGLDTYIQSIITTCDTETFIIDNRNIERLIYKGRQTITIDEMIDKVELKLQARTLSQFASQIEIYGHLLEAIRAKRNNPDRYKYNRQAIEPNLAQSDHKTTANESKDSTPEFNSNQPVFDNVKKLSAFERAVSLFAEQKALEHHFHPQKFSTASKPLSASVGKDRRHQSVQPSETRRHRVPRSRRQLEQLLGLRRSKETGAVYSYQGPVGLGSKASDNNRPKSSVLFDHRVFAAFPESQDDKIPENSSPNVLKLTTPTGVTSVAKKPQRIRPCTCIPYSQWYKYSLADEYDDDFHQREEERTLGLEETLFNDRHRNIILQMGEYRERTGSGVGLDNVRNEKRARYQTGVPIPVNCLDSTSEIVDLETSDEKLKTLERKMRSFQEQHNLIDGRPTKPSVIKLNRFTNKLPEGPRPPGTVCVSFQPACDSSDTTETRHVRRYIVPKEAYPIAREMTNVAEEQKRINEFNPSLPYRQQRLAKSAL